MTSRSFTRALRLAAASMLVLALTACGGLPTSGPVNAGRPPGATDSEGAGLVLVPDGPARDATPQQIVEGFIAAASGPRGTWETAKEFLAPEFRESWKPRAGVIVFTPGRLLVQEQSASEFTANVTPVAIVDGTGAMAVPSDDGEIPLEYDVRQQADGQWRITRAPDGIVLDRNRFATVFGSYALQFFDPTWSRLVPDIRWFPKTYAASNIVEALVEGAPTPWLAESVVTAFTDGARLAAQTVPVRSGVAEVSLQDGARAADQTVLDRMQTQLEVSLSAAGLVGVDLLVDGQVLPAQLVDVVPTRVDPRPLVRTAGAFGFLSGENVEPIAGLSEAITTLGADKVEVDAPRTHAAVRGADGTVYRVSGGEAVTVDTRGDLVAPSIDRYGFIWSVPSDEPSEVVASGPDGEVVAVPDSWPGAAELYAQRVARDGTRIAALVRIGESTALWTAGIIRDRNGVPVALGERHILDLLPGVGVDLAWIDATTLAALHTDGEQTLLRTLLVGGFASDRRTPDVVVDVAVGSSASGVRLRSVEGDLYTLSGANWQHLASGIDALAVQQGSPG